MSKMSKAIAILGVVAGLGVAALPLSTYAAIEGDYKTATSAQVEVTVEGAISISSNIDVVGTGGVLTLGNGAIMPGTTAENAQPLQIIVSSNSVAQYDLYIHTLETDGALVGQNTGARIMPLDAAGAISDGTEAWGYMYSADRTTWGTNYSPVPAGKDSAFKVNGDNKLETSADNKAAAENNMNTAGISYFKFKAGTKSTTTADTYQGTVVFTATATATSVESPEDNA